MVCRSIVRGALSFCVMALLALSCGFLGGCGALAPAAKTVTKGAVRGGFDEIDNMDPAVQDRVVRKLMDSAAVHDAAHDLLVAAVSGSVDGLTEAERQGKVNALVDASLDAMRRAGDAAMGDFITRFDKQISPILRTLVRELVVTASSAMREAAARDLPVIMSAVLDSAMRAFAVAASSASEQMRAQAKSFAEQDLGPIAGTISEQVARQAVIGIREGMHRDLDLRDPQVREGMREIGIGLAQGIAAGTPTSPFTTTFAISTFVLGGLFLVAVGIIISLYTRTRVSARVIAMLAERLDGHTKAGASVEDMVNDASDEPGAARANGTPRPSASHHA